MSIKDKAILVEVNLSVWSASKTDKEVSDDISIRKTGSVGNGRFVKSLMPSDPYLKEITRLSNKIRNVFDRETLDWEGSTRVLPIEKLDRWKEYVRSVKNTWDYIINEFISHYDTRKSMAQLALGDLYNEDDYPSEDELRSKFNFNVSYKAFPDTDFRVQVDEETMQELKASAEKNIATKTNEALASVWTKLVTNIEAIAKSTARDKGRIHASLFDNLRNLLDTIDAFNINSDPDIAAVAAEAKNLLVDIETIRKHKDSREEVATDAYTLLKKINTYTKPSQ